MMASTKPRLVLAMDPRYPARLFPHEAFARLHDIADVLPTVWTREHEPDGLESVDVIVSFWLSPAYTRNVLERLPRVQAILHAGGSIRAFIDESAWDRGIRVTTAADINAIPVARFTLGAILLAAKDSFTLARHYARGAYQLGDNERLGGYQRTVGIIGASRIGRALIPLLQPLDYRIIVSDPYLSDDDARALGVESVTLPELLRRSDVVSLHAPDVPETRGMLGREQFALMRDGATFINTARQALVDHDALLDELRSGRLTAVLDVTDPEPLPAGHPLFSQENAFITPHLAGAQGNELGLLGAAALDELERFVDGRPAAHPLTRDGFLRSA